MQLSYADRLNVAMKHAKCSRQMLSVGLNISYQGIKKVLDGKSNSMTAENNARASNFLNVSGFWLATGEGQMIEDGIESYASHTPLMIDKALQVLDAHLEVLAPILMESGRDVLKKWASGLATRTEVSATLSALQLASQTMKK